jgi:hypothetical protein
VADTVLQALTSVNFSDCRGTTTAAVEALKRGCPLLQEMLLGDYDNVSAEVWPLQDGWTDSGCYIYIAMYDCLPYFSLLIMNASMMLGVLGHCLTDFYIHLPNTYMHCLLVIILQRKQMT